jgi:hypothetical protein
MFKMVQERLLEAKCCSHRRSGSTKEENVSEWILEDWRGQKASSPHLLSPY